MKPSSLKYKSKYTERMVSASQIVAEKICEHIAKKNKKTLPNHFWEMEEYKKTFYLQIISANKLLKVFSAEAIILGLEECKSAYSLNAPFLIEVFKKHQNILDKKMEILNNIKESNLNVGNTEEKPRKPIGNKNILDKLE